MRQSKIRRKQQREAAIHNGNSRQRINHNSNLELDNVKAITFTQERVFREYANGQNLVLHGYAGTGKTFLAFYLGLRSIEEGEYDKIVVIRSLVPTRDAGFLPGDIKAKAEVYEGPYTNICAELYGRGDAYSILKQKGIVEFSSTSYIRGLTLDNCLIIVDEAQSLNEHELNSVLTRVGRNTRIILSGDYRQTDLQKQSEKEGFQRVLKRLQRMQEVSFIEFGPNDIVRSDFVKAWILSEYNEN